MSKRTIFHVDVNSAYLSWEAIDRLEKGYELDLRTVPSIVGGDEEKRHGIVLAKSIPAKKYGISTGETLFMAKRKCPFLKTVPPNYTLYTRCSEEMVRVLEEYSPLIQQYSIDEMFLDYTNMEKHFGEEITAAHEIKERIKKELGFTVNIGIGPNKLLAKMASELKKPDRVHTIYPDEIADKMWPLDTKELLMVGSRTREKLANRGIKTIGELARSKPYYLERFLKSHGILIWNYANGIENSPVRREGLPMKGLGNSSTLPFDVKDMDTAKKILLSLTETVSMRLRKSKKSAGLVSIKLKNSSFLSYSHQKKLEVPTDSTKKVYHHAKELLKEAWQKEPIRHMGIHLSDLCSNELHQLTIFSYNNEKESKMDNAIDKLRQKYGHEVLIRSCFLHSGLDPMLGGVIKEKDYPMMSSLL
ncbi:DNA polymerase Y family protein [Natranaerofaba carboxydovora]|uniref:DNA polymerase Y family protein n=1 Tax=Natranaerofaba carboxydovora TaxID=2742683 RepID=UPI001F1420AB|nr:DNA polymerase IV [Natranaerofaba carboxydovora]UMZ75449.1 DNA polymerase IV [Natranaerofaba carboxydovora]